MIRPVDHHPQANILTLAHANWRHQRFGGTEADSEYPMRHPKLTEKDLDAAAAYQPSYADDDESGWPTTRRFARSAHGTEAAWPDDPQYAEPFERFERGLDWLDGPLSRWAVIALIACVIALAAAWLKVST